mmetsp:Transcript_5580/g.14507  ORF Transcript_5580/g.14507 Transcript_5580/m.14507 type:complete len:283 (-) Transcript_5580:177-1025(-)
MPEILLRDVGAVDELVAAAEVNVLPQRLDLVSHVGTLRVPEHEASSRLLLDGEQVEVLADKSVVAPRSLFLQLAVLHELLFRLPRRSIHALQHGPRLVASPVRSRHLLEVDRVACDVRRLLDVRSSAQVPPAFLASRFADVVDGDRFLLDGVKNFELVWLVDSLDARLRLVARHLLTHDGKFLSDDFLHFLFDFLQVRVRERLLGVKVVVEPVVDPRSDGHLHVREEPLRRHGKYVRGAVPDAQKFVVRFVRRKFGQGQRLRFLRRLSFCFGTRGHRRKGRE